MLKRFKEVGLVGPFVMTLLGLAILVGLGTWQLQRKALKDGLVAMIEARVKAPPVPLEEPLLVAEALGKEEYRPVTVSGRFRHEDERHVYSIDNGVAGWDVFTPLETAGGHLLFVNRGFVPDEFKAPATRRAGQVQGGVAVTGLVRAPGQQGLFVPASDPARNMWYWRDLEGMIASLSVQDRRVLPFFIDAVAVPANPGGWPKGGATMLNIPNRHLEYVLTWYGLALTLVGVFVAFAVSRLRKDY